MRRVGRLVTGFDDEAIAWLLAQPWPAHFIDLEATVRRALPRASGIRITRSDLISSTEPSRPEDLPSEDQDGQTDPEGDRDRLCAALDEAGGDISEAARLLGMNQMTLMRKLERYADD